MEHETAGRHISRAAAFAAVAPLLVPFAAALWMVVGWAAGTNPFWPTPELNVAEAAAVRDHAEVVRLIQRGDNPNERWPVRASLIDDEHHMMTPLEVAVVIRRLELVKLLIRHGARVTTENRISLINQAAAAAAPDIVEFLQHEAL